MSVSVILRLFFFSPFDFRFLFKLVHFISFVEGKQTPLSSSKQVKVNMTRGFIVSVVSRELLGVIYSIKCGGVLFDSAT